jgi:hypothetical protein
MPNALAALWAWLLAIPSKRDFQGMIRHNLLKDYPVTNEDIHNAHVIFGPGLAIIRGKTVHHEPERVVTDYVEIPSSGSCPKFAEISNPLFDPKKCSDMFNLLT